MSTALYVRVSTDEQRKTGYSISEQKDRLEAYSKAMGYKNLKHYEDPGFSGTNLDRPAIKKMIRDIKSGLINKVVIWKLDRISRSQRDTLYLVQDILITHNVDFVSLNENLDTSTPMGIAMIGIMSAFAELEVNQIKERMAMGLEARAKSGKPMSWNYKTFGYDYENHEYVINEVEAEIVRSMFEFYVNNPSITALADNLNAKGHIKKQHPWARSTIRALLKNPLYIGKNTYKGTIYEGNHEPIIDEALFNQAQKLLKKAQREHKNTRPFESKYILSGIIRCGHCDAPMELRMGRKHKSGYQKKFYHCRSRRQRYKDMYGLADDHQCPIDQDDALLEDLEGRVLKEIDRIRLNPEALQRDDEDLGGKIAMYEKEIKSVNVKMDKLTDLYLDGFINREQLSQRSYKLTEQIEDLKAYLEDLKDLESQQTNTSLDALESLQGSISNINYESQNAIVKQIIKQVTLYKNEIAIEWVF